MYDVIAGEPVFEGYAADLPEVEPTEADLAAIELLPAEGGWELVQDRLVAVDVQRARFGEADEVAERRFRRSVTTLLRRQLAVEEIAEGAIA